MRLPERFREFPVGFAAFLLAVAIFKLWLVSGQMVQALPHAAHDDFLFIENARNVADGRWLGSYTSIRLTKGAGYPLWVAVNSWLHAPVLLMQQVLYLAACLATVLALRKHVAQRWIGGVIFLLLALNPATYTQQVTHTIREGIYPALGLFITAAVIGGTGPALSRGWLVALGFFLAWFRITREEWQWILPLTAVGLAVYLFRLIPLEKAERWRRVGWAFVPLVIYFAGTLAIATGNHYRYGFFGTTETTDGALPKAVSALFRVEPAQWQQFVAVPREMRGRLAEVSPAFAEIRPFLDGEPGSGWAIVSRQYIPTMPEGEIAYGWFQWALIDAVNWAGYDTPPKAQAFYARLASEIEAARAAGKLKWRTAQYGLVPAWHNELRWPLLDSFQKGVRTTADFADMSFEQRPSLGPDLPKRLATIQRMTNTPLAVVLWPGEAVRVEPNEPRLRAMLGIHSVYAAAGQYLFGAAALAWLFLLFIQIRKRRPSVLWILAGGVAAAALVRVLLLAYLHAAAFPTINATYLLAIHPMFLLFAGLVAADAINQQLAASSE